MEKSVPNRIPTTITSMLSYSIALSIIQNALFTWCRNTEPGRVTKWLPAHKLVTDSLPAQLSHQTTLTESKERRNVKNQVHAHFTFQIHMPDESRLKNDKLRLKFRWTRQNGQLSRSARNPIKIIVCGHFILLMFRKLLDICNPARLEFYLHAYNCSFVGLKRFLQFRN